jgi:hypothetical protein
MRQRSRVDVLLAVLVTLSLGGVANAEKLEYFGSHTLRINNLGIEVTVTGIGVANVGTDGNGHLTTLQLPAHFPGGRMNTTIPITDPIVNQTIPSVRITDFRIDPQAQGGIFAPISGAVGTTTPQLTQATMPITGRIRICLFFAGCNSGSIDQTVGQTYNGVRTGVGVGGLVTFNPEGAAGIRISVEGAPWTVGTTSGSSRTDNGGLTTITAMGFAHGPSSGTSSTAVASGVVQLVNMAQVTTVGIPTNDDKNVQINTLTIHFIPEPGLLLLLGSGAVTMALLGRKRLKR